MHRGPTRLEGYVSEAQGAAAAEESDCLFEKRGSVAIVTLNRPKQKNALSGEMLVGMWDAWQEIDSDPEIRVAILTGAGGTFCAGADLKAMAGGDQSPRQAKTKQRMADDPDLHWKALPRHYRLMKPLIAAVEGYAIAGGTEILQACEIRVAAEGATFGIAEVRRGLFPLGGSTVRLRRQIPETIAAELLLTGRFVPAAEAKEIGLIGHVVPKGEALNKALEIAAQISETARSQSRPCFAPFARPRGCPRSTDSPGNSRLVSRSSAPMILRAKKIDGPHALKIGLVQEVHPISELKAAAHSLALELAAMPPVAIVGVLRCVVGAGDASLDEALAEERRAVQACSGTGDQREGMRAFLEKRRPIFTGE